MARPRYFEWDEADYRYGLRYLDEEDNREKQELSSEKLQLEEKDVAASDNKSASKRGGSHTRGTAISFGFRRRPAATGIPVPIAHYQDQQQQQQQHQRSKSVGPEHESRRRQQHDDDYCCQPASRYQNYSSSGRSTPRLAPPKKESSGLPVRVNRFGFRNQPHHGRFTDKVTDLAYNSHVNRFNQEEQRQSRSPQALKPRPSPINQPSYLNHNNQLDANRRSAELAAAVGKYTLHSSNLPQPQYAVRMSDKVAKTAVNQSRKQTGSVRVTSFGACSSKEGSGTEDSGVGSQHDERGRARYDYYAGLKPRKLGVVVTGKSFDVRDVDDEEHCVTEISVIPLPKNFAQQQLQRASPNVRERASQYQRALLSKDNRYTDSTTSMSTTSSEGYDEGLGEEKVYEDRSRTEKLAAASSTSSSMMRSAEPSSDEQDEQFGPHGGEAMADEYSISSSDDFQQRLDDVPVMPCNTVTQSTVQHFKAISNAARTGALPTGTLRSVLLTIEDPAFAAVAATTTTLIDDETSPVDSLFDSPTASVVSDVKAAQKKEEENVMERSGNTIDDDSPGTPTNASNSLSLSEGREFFDDEIADQPGLVFDETLRDASTANTEHSQTVLESVPKITALHNQANRSVENSPMHGRKMNRAGSVSTLSSCESLASDDMMMDYERSDASSFGDLHSRGNSTFVMQDLDDATSLLELEIQGQEVMREWNTLLGQSQQALSNTTNNNINSSLNNNTQQNTDNGLNNRATRLLNSRSSSESPRSLDGTPRNRQYASPLRPPRNLQSPSLNSDDEGSIRMERGTYSYMFQDIVSIKTMLLKLKRVLQESGENGVTRTDPLNPFDNTLKNGLFYNLNDGGSNATTTLTTDASTSPNDGRDVVAAEELADLRRQVVYLQGQVDDKDRLINSLQAQLEKYQNASNGEITNNGREDVESCNAATQTDKLRPVSAGPSILQGLSQENSSIGPLVSYNEPWTQSTQHQQPHYQQHQQIRRPSGICTELSSPSSTRSSSRRSSSDSLSAPSPQQQQARPTSLRGLRLPNGHHQHHQATVITPPDSPKNSTTRTSSIPTPRRLATPTLIPRAARAVSATGRAHNS